MKVDKLLIHLVLIVYFIITIFLSTYSYKLLIVFLGISVLIFFITIYSYNYLGEINERKIYKKSINFSIRRIYY